MYQLRYSLIQLLIKHVCNYSSLVKMLTILLLFIALAKWEIRENTLVLIHEDCKEDLISNRFCIHTLHKILIDGD